MVNITMNLKNKGVWLSMGNSHENYFVWLFSQLKGWPVQNYCLWFFAFGFQLALLIEAKVTTVTIITFIGTLLGTLCVLAINATKAINGWLGLISAACFIYAGLALSLIHI